MNKRPDQADVSINIFEQIDEICREFRKSLKSGDTPRIETYLNRVEDSAHPNLFTNLLVSELKHRFQSGDTPKSNDYLKRFPQFANIIRQEFDESTMGSMDFNVDPAKGSTGTASVIVSDGTQTRTFEEPAASRLGDYELIRELGRGGFGVVYEARHIKQKNKVALKTLPTGSDGQEINADRLHKFRREFRTLSEINHPNLVGMQTLEFDGNQWFFTMDLIQGTDFLSYVRPKDWLDEKHLRSSLKQLAAGIMALHEKGIVHRDLKPSNVLVEPNGRVVILDFGLVAQLQQNTDMTATRSAMFAGTPRYAAPEQMFGERSEASDWYAMGVMLYEALTGAPPFPGRNPMEVLRQKQDEDPPSISAQGGIPADLSSLADALIKRDPKQRLTTNQIAQQLQLDLESTKQQSAGSTDDEDIDLDAIPEEEIELIGREKQLAQLESAKQQLLETRKPVVCWITGLSGEGKSALAEKFLAPIRRGTEMLVLSGRCYDRESVPFKVIDSQIDSLVRYLRSLSEAEVDCLLPRDIELLARIFPVLYRVDTIKDRKTKTVDSLNEEQIKNVALSALRELIANISSKIPVIMFVDDLQWGDADSAEAMINLIAPPANPAVLLLGSIRKDEMETCSFLKHWNESSPVRAHDVSELVVEVEALTVIECRDYVFKNFGHDAIGAEELEKLYSNSKGNPYFLEQLLEGFNFQTGELIPVPLVEIIQKRINRCPDHAATILDLIAIAGQAISIDELAVTGGHKTLPSAVLTHMRSEKLVRLVGTPSEQLVDTYHDKIRETIIEAMGAQKRQKLHLDFAESILSQEVSNEKMQLQGLSIPKHDRIFDLAHHLYEARDDRAFEYQLSAAQHSLDAHAIENALEHLYRAEEVKPENIQDELAYRFHYHMGNALKGGNQFEESIHHLKKAVTKASNRLERATCFYVLGQIYWLQSRYDDAFASVRSSTREFGAPLPKSNFFKVISGITALLSFHLQPSWLSFTFRRLTEDELVLLSRLYDFIQQLVLTLDPYQILYATGQLCKIAKKSKNPDVKRVAYAAYAGILTVAGASWLGRRVMRVAERYEAKDELFISNSTFEYWKGIYNYTHAQLNEAEKMFFVANDKMSKSKDYKFYLVHHFFWHIYELKGNAKKQLFHSKKEQQIGRISNDQIAEAFGKYGQGEALSRLGHYDLAESVCRQSIDILQKVNSTFLLIGYNQLARVQIQQGKYDEACSSSFTSIKIIPKLRVYEFTVTAFSLFAEGKLSSKWYQKNQVSRKQLNHASRAAFAARITGWLFPTQKPHACRITGRLCAAKGKTKKALKYFDKAIAAAEKIGARYEHSRALIDKSMLDHPDAMADRERGLQMLHELECVLPLAEQEYLGIEMPAYELEEYELEEFELDKEVTV